MGRHIASIGHIIPIPGQLDFALFTLCYVLRGEATNTNCIVFGKTRAKPMVLRTHGEHAKNYITDAVL